MDLIDDLNMIKVVRGYFLYFMLSLVGLALDTCISQVSSL